MNWTDLNLQVDAKRKEYAELDAARSRVMAEMHVLAMTNGCTHARDCMYTTASAEQTRGCYGCDREELLEMKRQAKLVDVILESPLKPSLQGRLAWIWYIGDDIVNKGWMVGGHDAKGVGQWFVLDTFGTKHYRPTNKIGGWMDLIRPSHPTGYHQEVTAA